jgi:hypothetical protein
MRLGMPRDFDELVRFHGAVISTVSRPEDVLMIAHHLWYRGILEAFRPPREITLDQVMGYLGLYASEGPRGGGRPWAFRTWHLTARTRPDVLPKPVDGGSLGGQDAKYLFSDAERLYARRDEIFPRLSQLGFFSSVIPGLEDYILAETKKLVDELELGYIFDVPLHLPQSADEIMTTYSPTVMRVVRYRLKFGIDVEDAIDEVWLKLLSSNLLVKFMRSGPKRLPAHMTTEEVLDFLGVEWRTWRSVLGLHPDHAPNPVKGSSDSLEAIYHSEDIRALDGRGYFKKRGLRYLPASSVSREMFDKYVATAAEHALKNLFRTLDRRFNREDTMQEGACIQDNRRARVPRRDDVDFSWEDTLSDNGALPLSGSGISNIAADNLIDIKRRAKAASLVQQTA